MNKLMMGKSGFFTKKSMLVTTGIKLSKKSGGCNSVNPIMYEIKSKDHLKRLTGRMYRTPYMRDFAILKGNETDLIGTTILMRSPTTCTSYSRGDGVCEHCYGPALYHTNRGIDVGAYASAISTNPVGQNILSTKHLLTTDSVHIEFNELFYTFFNLCSNEIVITNQNVNLSDYSLVIIKDNIVTLNELNEGSINEFVTIFHVRNEKTGEMYEFRDKDGIELFISPEFREYLELEKKHKKTYEVNLGTLPDNSTLFLIQIENNELTRPLYEIMGVLDSKKKREELGINDRDISAFTQRMLDLFIVSHINVMAIHSEIMITPLIRSIDDILERPNFTKYSAMDKTKVLTISSALERHPSPLIGMSFAYLERQLKNPLTFKKSGSSFIDSFYRTEL